MFCDPTVYVNQTCNFFSFKIVNVSIIILKKRQIKLSTEKLRFYYISRNPLSSIYRLLFTNMKDTGSNGSFAILENSTKKIML